MAQERREVPQPKDIEPGYVFHDLRAEGMADRLAQAPVFTKFGQVRARLVSTPEDVITRIQGKEETRNKANAGDFVVTGPQGEDYVLGAAKLEARYRPVDGQPGVYEAFGKIRAVDNPHGEKIAIEPSWGGYQYGDPDCKVATTVDVKTEEPNNPEDIYIIDRKSFDETYKPR